MAANQFEVRDYDYNRLQKDSAKLEEFEDDLIYLINESNDTKTVDKTTKHITTKQVPSEQRKISPLPNETSRSHINLKKVNINDILADLDDMGLSSDDDDKNISPVVQKKSKGTKREKLHRKVALESSPETDNTSPEDVNHIADDLSGKKLKSKKRSNHGKEARQLLRQESSSTKTAVPLNSGEFKFNIDDDEENKLNLSRKQKMFYRVLRDEYNIKCETKEELESKVKELGLLNKMKRETKNKAQNETKSGSPQPVEQKKLTSVSLLTNNPEYYNEHTTRLYTLKDLKILPFTDDVIKTVILKASPKLKKLMELLILNSDFFQRENYKEVAIFFEDAIKVALEMPTYFTARFNSKPIIPRLSDHSSQSFQLLNKFGDDMIRGDEYLNIDLLALLGHILIWWNFHSATPKKKFFLVHHWRQFSNNSIRSKIGGLHLWDIESYQNANIYDSQWTILEKMRINFRYEEDQFYVTLRLMNIDL